MFVVCFSCKSNFRFDLTIQVLSYPIVIFKTQRRKPVGLLTSSSAFTQISSLLDLIVSWPWSDRKSSMVCSRKERWRTERPGFPMRRDAYTSSWRRRIWTAAQPQWVPERGETRGNHIFKKDHGWHLMLHSCPEISGIWGTIIYTCDTNHSRILSRC